MTSQYVVLLDADAQERADKERNQILLKQDGQIRDFWRKRLGFVEFQAPRLRRQYYLQHLPVFTVGISLDDFLDATDHPDIRAEFWAQWAMMASQLFDMYPPPGPVQGNVVDVMTGQPAIIDPGPPNLQLRLQVWGIEQARFKATDPLQLNNVRDMGCVLAPFWRERWFYAYKGVLKQLHDMRRVLREVMA